MFFFVFIYLTLSRTSIDFSFSLVLWPFFSESIFGSYGALQVLSFNNSGFDITGSSLYFFNDLIQKFMPNIFFDLFPFLEFDYFNAVVQSAIKSGALESKIYPLGGHFFLSEYVFYFGFLTPLIFPLTMYLYLRLIHKLPVELYIFFVSSFFLLIKAPIFVLLKISTLSIIGFCIFFVICFFLPKRKRCKNG